MNRKIYSLMALAAATVLASCGGGSDKGPVNPSPTPGESTQNVEVTISTASVETKAAKLEFGGGDKMNIFAKTYGRIDAPNIKDGVVASYDGTKWTLEPAVTINDGAQKNAFIYAVAPYDASYTDAQRIPVDVNKQVDLMYSGAYVPASYKSPAVKLNMKHALSMLTFNIVPVNYNGAGNVESVSINGEIVYTKGVMDASTGKITSLTDNNKPVSAKVGKTLISNGWTSNLPNIWTLPFNTKTGNVTFTAVVDGKTYETLLPEVEVKTGWQYIMRLVLTNSGLEFDPSKTETISLNVTTDEAQQFAGYGVLSLVASGASLLSPELTGDAVFGTLVTPTATTSYTTAVKVDGLKSGDAVILESWNSDGFIIESLEGVATIDVSGYE